MRPARSRRWERYAPYGPAERAHAFVLEVDVRPVEADELAHSQTHGVERLEHRAVALSPGFAGRHAVEQSLGIVDGQEDRQTLLDLRRHQARGRIVTNLPRLDDGTRKSRGSPTLSERPWRAGSSAAWRPHRRAGPRSTRAESRAAAACGPRRGNPGAPRDRSRSCAAYAAKHFARRSGDGDRTGSRHAWE